MGKVFTSLLYFSEVCLWRVNYFDGYFLISQEHWSLEAGEDVQTNDFMCRKGGLFADKPLEREWNCLFRAQIQVGQEACTLLPWHGHRVPPSKQGPDATVKLSLPSLTSWLQQAGHRCAGVGFDLLWLVEGFLYTWVFQTLLKPPIHLCMLLNFCPVCAEVMGDVRSTWH